jgi:hypothetical protein
MLNYGKTVLAQINQPLLSSKRISKHVGSPGMKKKDLVSLLDSETFFSDFKGLKH